MSDGIRMVRDSREEWPEDVPPGTYDISEFRLDKRHANALILFVCPNGKRCSVAMGPTPEPRPTDKEPGIWGWDGNRDAPTLTPSINCLAEKDGKPTSGCGWHGFITAGVMK